MQASARLSSSAAFRKVIAGASSAAATRSCYRTSRGKAHAAAPLPAQEPPRKGQKLSKQERRARIVEFVENYRASNEGKFPTITTIRQQVGGCHYRVREALQEMKYNHAKLLPLDNPKEAPLQGTVEVIEQRRPKDEVGVAESQEVSEHSMSKDDVEVAQLQGTDQVSDHSFPKDEDAPALSDQTETQRMKDLMDNPNPGNQQREIEANKLDLKNSEEALNANDSYGSEQTGSDMMNEAKTHAREDNPKLEESANTGLLGSLKSFAYGIRNFWKNM